MSDDPRKAKTLDGEQTKCTHPARYGRHEDYARPDGSSFCRACGMELGFWNATSPKPKAAPAPDSDIGGWATTEDGKRVPISRAEADAIFAAIKERDAKDAEDMPDTDAALSALCRAMERMARLGWRRGIYCPKDGSEFAFVEFGSSGIFAGRYSGKWPKGWIDNGDGSTRPEGAMWKPIEMLTDDERATFDRCMASHSAWIASLGDRLGSES